MKSYDMTHVAEVEINGAMMLGLAGYGAVMCESVAHETETLQAMTGGACRHPGDWNHPSVSKAPGDTQQGISEYHEQHGSEPVGVNWKKVTTEDLRATFVNFPHDPEAIHALLEYERRCGADYFTKQWDARLFV